MGYGFYRYYYGARELKYVMSIQLSFGHGQPGSPINAYIYIYIYVRQISELFQANKFPLHSELAREKMWSRIHLTPLLQAEEDRDQVRRHYADQAREKELLGTETRVYHSDRCVERRKLALRLLFWELSLSIPFN